MLNLRLRFTISKTKLISPILFVFFLFGCVFRFENAPPLEGAKYTRVYFPSASDLSSYGGQAARVTMAARRAVANDTRVVLVPIHLAEIAVELQIESSQRTTTSLVECKIGNEELASFSRNCADAKDNLRMPDASVEAEAALLDIRLQIVDLQKGTLLVNTVLKNLSSGSYPLVGDDTAKSSLRRFPELHALRYAENVDAAIARIGSQVGTQVLQNLIALQSTQ